MSETTTTFAAIERALEDALAAISHESFTGAEHHVEAALEMVREMNPFRCRKCGGHTENWSLHLCSPNGGVNLPLSGPEAKALLVAEIGELRSWVVTFGAPWAASYGEGRYGSARHLHPSHYDILARCGARMDDFVRMEA